MGLFRSVLAASWILALGCTEDPGVVVDLRTNLLAGVDFQEARLHVEGAEPATDAVRETLRRPVTISDGRDLRVGELSPLAAGRYWVTVELWTSFEARVATQRVAVTVDRPLAVTVLITADCAGVVCPGTGDSPDATYCLSARCVPQTCLDAPTAPGCPAPECSSGADCATAADCAEARCEEGVCYVEPDDARCAGGAICHLERGCLEVAMDAGTTCTPGSCDDFNPCTDDVCGESGCEATPNAAPCDDGVFCNGADTCAGAICATHTGSPCGDAMCDEGMRTCASCLSDADCPADGVGAWSACVFGDVCDELGERTRIATTFACEMGACRPTMTTEREGCPRETDGTTCSMTAPGAWTDCDYLDSCDESATRVRDVTTYACAAGACAPSTEREIEGCTRETDGTVCGMPMIGAFGACDWADACDEDAVRSRDVTVYECAAGTCGASVSSEDEGCARETDMDPCGDPLYGTFSACDYADACDETASRQRDVTRFACAAGSCGSTTAPEMEVCTRTTDGASCEDGAYCNGDDRCASGACTHGGDPCVGGTVCDESGEACWFYGNDGTHCSASAYYELGGSAPPPPGGYSMYAPPEGCNYAACTTFCQINYCMPCPGGDCGACPL